MALAWYNEPDPGKAQWLRELMKAGVIAPGDVDERSIREVKANELVGYTQRHFFAGIGVWSYALRQAGWPDDRPVDTGSCPCPSFSEAGKGEGFDDDRHLWPVWDTLIGEFKPTVLFGEQSHAAIGFGWLDLVCGNLEAKGYAVAATVLGAHSVGAPHRRQRLYFCADTADARHHHAGQHGSGLPLLSARPEQCGDTLSGSDTDGGRQEARRLDRQDNERGNRFRESCPADSTASPELRATGYSPNADGRNSSAEREQRSGEQRFQPEDCGAGEHHDAKCEGLEGHFGDVREWRGPGWLDPLTARSVAEAGATRGFWRDCDWWYGRDEKYRPIGPGLFPLASRATSRVLRLRGYGDSIVAPLAIAWIKAYLEARRRF